MPEDQAAGLRRIQPLRPVKVIAVASGKGGVGKTSISANLAIGLGELGRRVMLLDADVGLANVDVMLGLQPRHTLADVFSGRMGLDEIVVEGPAGLRILPGGSGVSGLTDLDGRQHGGLISAFSTLRDVPDILLVDTAAGVSRGVLQYAAAAGEVLVVLCDEPASLTDSYALIKLLSTCWGVRRFRIVTNMTRRAGDGRIAFHKLQRVTDRFLEVQLEHTGSIPWDARVARAIQLQLPFVTAFPNSVAAAALKNLARRADNWSMPRTARGGIEFFVERLLAGSMSTEHAAA
ncbi:MAG: MinD/ParA family protein [Chromatiales bacterium]|nr:MinD/ParA family protein [Chromatiales bacterium]